VRGTIVGSGAFRNLGRSIAFASTSFLGAAGFVSVVRQSIGAADALNNQISRTNTVFGRSAGEVKAWSKTTATSFGLARDQALDYADTFGQILKAADVAPARAAKLSQALVARAADVASANNVNVSETLSAFQQGLAGRGRAALRFGVNLAPERVQAEALTLGLVKSSVNLDKVRVASDKVAIAQAKLTKARKDYGANTTQVHEAEDRLVTSQGQLRDALGGTVPKLTSAQKLLASYQLIMDGTARSSGNFRRSSGSLSNQMQVLRAQVRNLEAGIGRVLLPTVLRIVRRMNEWLSQSKNQATVLRDVHHAVRILGQVVQGATGFIKSLIGPAETVKRILGGWKGVIAALLALKLATTVGRWTSAISGQGGLLTALRSIRGNWQVAVVVVGLAAAIAGVKLLGDYLNNINRGGPALQRNIANVEAKLKVGQPSPRLLGTLAGTGGVQAFYDPVTGRLGTAPPGGGPVAETSVFTSKTPAERARLARSLGLTPAQLAAKMGSFGRSRRQAAFRGGLWVIPGTDVPLGAAEQRAAWAAWRAVHINLAPNEGSVVSLAARAAPLRSIIPAAAPRTPASTSSDVGGTTGVDTGTGGLVVGERARRARRARTRQPVFTALTPALQAQLLAAEGAAAGGGVPALRNLLAVEQRVAAFLRDEHKTGKDLVKVERERAAIKRLIVSTEGKIHAAEKKTADAAAARRTRIQFQALGLTTTGEPLLQSVRTLRKRYANLAGTVFDNATQTKQFKVVGQELRGKFQTLGKETRRWIQDFFDQISGDTTSQTVFVGGLGRFLTGLNLTEQQMRAARARFAQPTFGRTGAPAFALAGGGTVFTGDINVHGVQDVEGFKRALQREAGLRSHPRRGRGAGSGRLRFG
jgi:hypothetical protein